MVTKLSELPISQTIGPVIDLPAGGSIGAALREAIDDRVAALLTASGTVTWDYNDVLNTLQAAAAAGTSDINILLDEIAGTEAAGDLLYRGASAYARLAAGTQGGLMWQSTDGSNPIPAWSSKWTVNTSGTLAGATGTITSSTPALSITQTWNAVGTTFKGATITITDTASASGSLPLEILGGASGTTVLGRLDKAGRLDAISLGHPSYSTANIAFVAASTIDLTLSSSVRVRFSNGNIATTEAFSIGATAASPDVFLYRDAAATLALRNGTNAQTFRVYNTYTSSTNYELGCFKWDTSILKIGTEKGSGGGTARALELQTDGTTAVTFTTDQRARFADGSEATPSISFANETGFGLYRVGSGNLGLSVGGSRRIVMATGVFAFSNAVELGWYSSGFASMDVRLARDAAATLALRNGANAQTFRVYNTYTSSTNHEYVMLDWLSAGNFAVITTVAGSAGGTCRGMGLGSGNAVGTNIPGGDTYVFAGAGTGTGTPGRLYFQTSSTTGSGTTVQTKSNRLTIDSGITANALLTISGGLTFSDANNVITNATTGTKVCTATTQKLAFWNATPVVQPSSASQSAVTDTAGASYTAAEQTMLGNLKTLVNQLRADLVTIGLIKGAA